jgi:hypothetical protein
MPDSDEGDPSFSDSINPREASRSSAS